MIPVDAHRATVAALMPAARRVRMRLAEAAGRALADDLRAPISLPPFTNSSMDGYAVRAAEVHSGVTLPVAEDIPAGRTDALVLAPGTAHRIMTGAPLPVGADAIVPVEATSGQGFDATHVCFTGDASAGQFVRRAGSDIEAGEVALERGTVIGPAQVGLAAALGVPTVSVLAPLRVLVLSTGSELVTPGEPLSPGQIYESNSVMLAAAIRAAGADAESLRFVPDDVAHLRRVLGERLDAGDVDLVITSGGVSAGAYEVVKEAFTGGFADVDFVKVAMQPGMPQGAGHIVTPGRRRVPVVTLPGNPVSSLVSFEVFVREPLRAALGLPARRPRRTAVLAAGVQSIPGKRQFLRGALTSTDGNDSVIAVGGHGSHFLRWMASADCLIDIAPEVEEVVAGATVTVVPLAD
ncbi:molybdopterin molybdotransferase MoeA [Tsukamurella soli]|uniref:Molybdopterin molybdenumtransferase n=1 Tax=Tsukamurella soli TaxID=644556 RepID=A0ABP8KK23_9ACTN